MAERRVARKLCRTERFLLFFCWEKVELNLPGSSLYSPVKPWVSKRRRDGTLAADSVSFVDNICPTGPTEADSRQASQVMAKELPHRGIQDAVANAGMIAKHLGHGLGRYFILLTPWLLLWLSKPNGTRRRQNLVGYRPVWMKVQMWSTSLWRRLGAF